VTSRVQRISCEKLTFYRNVPQPKQTAVNIAKLMDYYIGACDSLVVYGTEEMWLN